MTRIASNLAVLAVVMCAAAPAAEKYSGPRPAKPDVPYLLHADSLVETEATQAKEQAGKKDDSQYIIPGAASPVRTPLAEPTFLLLSDKTPPDTLQLFRLEVKNGARQVTLSPRKKGGARPLRIMVTRLDDRLYKLEVDEGLGLENGEYSFSPTGSNDAFCFEVY